MAPENLTPTKERILSALGQVLDPALGKDLVSLGMIKDLEIQGETVRFAIALTTPEGEKIKAEARQAVESIPGVGTVEILLTPGDQRGSGLMQHEIRNTIAIASGKGGVGKSTIAVNVAVALAQSGAQVGLLDADIYGPNIPTMMGVERIPPPENNKLIPAEAYRVRLMSIGFLVQPDQPLIWRGPMLHSAIQQFIHDVAWGALDYLIVDLPPGTGDAQLSLTQSIPLSGGVIVTLPQKVSIEDARRGLEMFRTMEVPILGVIENMSFLELDDGQHVDVFGQGGGQDLAQAAEVTFLGAIALDPHVREGGDSGVPIVISHPESSAAKSLTSIAQAVAAKLSIQAEGGSEVIPIEILD